MNVLNSYRDNHSSSDDDSEDSDKECTVWKRATAAKRKIEPEILPDDTNKEMNDEASKPKRKVNTIWTEILQDQLISEDLEDCLLKNKPAHYDSRGKESYDYTLKYSDPRVKDDIEDSPMEEESFDKNKSHDPLKNKFNRKRYVKLNGTERDAARKIIKVLNEKKVYLIERIVKLAGVQKALTLLSMTEEIEENGGMMINNNARRRTPGGVYLQLLKADKDVTQEMLDQIFEGEMNAIQLKQYYVEKKKKKKQFLKQKKQQKNIEKDMMKTEPRDSKMDEETNSSDLVLQSPVEINNSIPIPIPITTKDPSENISDLEEGEIDD